MMNGNKPLLRRVLDISIKCYLFALPDILEQPAAKTTPADRARALIAQVCVPPPSCQTLSA